MTSSLIPPSPYDFTRDHLSAYFENTWQLYDELFATFDDDALSKQPDPLRHPLVFYLGHTAAFYINKLLMAGIISQGVDPELERLFARGVDPRDASDLDAQLGWPDAHTARDYRARCKDVVRRVIARSEPEPVSPAHPLWALFMGLEHDRIHLETSSVLIRQLHHPTLERPASWRLAPTHTSPPQERWLTHPASSVHIGRSPAEGGLFGWDNEFGHATHTHNDLEVSAHLVSHHDFLAFLEDGGYHNQALWSAQGWQWRSEHQLTHPRFWRRDEHSGWMLRAMFEELPLPMSWPVEVTAHEAHAYCKWRGHGTRLLSEAEHTSLTRDAPLVAGDVIACPDYNLNLRFASSTPVDHLPATPCGLHDPYGNVWEWLSSPFTPLEGFAPHPLYDDFSHPYFGEDHLMMRAGSWASSGTSASRHYRLWFRPHFMQHAGFRIARDLS